MARRCPRSTRGPGRPCPRSGCVVERAGDEVQVERVQLAAELAVPQPEVRRVAPAVPVGDRAGAAGWSRPRPWRRASRRKAIGARRCRGGRSRRSSPAPGTPARRAGGSGSRSPAAARGRRSRRCGSGRRGPAPGVSAFSGNDCTLAVTTRSGATFVDIGPSRPRCRALGARSVLPQGRPCTRRAAIATFGVVEVAGAVRPRCVRRLAGRGSRTSR